MQRPLWASTGTKNPKYSDVLYVESLIGADTVDTIPPATFAAFRDHGKAASRLKEGTEEALQILEKVKKAGVNLNEVTQKLEEAGVVLFCDSYKKLIEGIQVKKK